MSSWVQFIIHIAIKNSYFPSLMGYKMPDIKEKPILFSAPMVMAILDGHKTQTRRVVKDIPMDLHYGKPIMDYGLSGIAGLDNNVLRYTIQDSIDSCNEFKTYCPYGKIGDRLWVRETFAESDRPDGTPVIVYKTGENIPVCRVKDKDSLIKEWESTENVYVEKWKPSIHMPRWASRINLEITNIRVERLKDISKDDVVAEGCFDDYPANTQSAINCYRDLWQSLNGIDSWDLNPWVWIIEFRRV